MLLLDAGPRGVAIAMLSALLLRVPGAEAAVTVFAQDLSGFIAAAQDSTVYVDFEQFSPGADLGGLIIGETEFVTTGAALLVAVGDSTHTPATGWSSPVTPDDNRLFATTGGMVLSPGGDLLTPGPLPSIENDDLTLRFQEPVAYFGFDHLSQSADGWSYTAITVLGLVGDTLYAGIIPISTSGAGYDPPGDADFWGLVSEGNDISAVVIDEADANPNHPDCNIGFDTIRLGRAQATGVSVSTEDSAMRSMLLVSPNPFVHEVLVYVVSPVQPPMSVSVFDIAGRLINSLASPEARGQTWVFKWDGRTGDGHRAAAGVYFVRVSPDPGVRGVRIVLKE